MESSTFDRLAKIAAGCAAVIVCAVFWTLWVGPIPIIGERVDRIAYSLGFGVGCGSTTVKRTVIELIEDRSFGSGRPASMKLDIPSVGNSGWRGEVQQCRGVLLMRFSSQVAEQLAGAIQSDEILQEQVRHIWDVSRREASVPIDYEITRDTTYVTGRTLFGLLPFKELARLASEYERANEQVASVSTTPGQESNTEIASAGNTSSANVPTVPEFIDDRTMASICHEADGKDRLDYLDKVEAALENKQIRITLKASTYSRNEKIINAEISSQFGASEERTEATIDTGESDVPIDLKEGARIIVDGEIQSSVLWGNVVEGCYLKIKATKVTLDGF